MKIGLIGLGRMGREIAVRIKAAGMDVVVYNRSAEKTKDWSAAGGRVATDIKTVCHDRDIVITVLADDAALNEIAFGAGGICETLPRGGIHMIMGTHGAPTVRAAADRHAKAGQLTLHTPVLGRPEAAAAGQLGIVVGGAPAAAQRCKGVIDAIARRVFEAGDLPEHASIVKLANGLVLAIAIEAMGEGFSLVRKYGVDAKVLYDVMTEGLFAAPAYKGYGKLIAEQDYGTVGFTVDLGLKDVRLMLAAADAGKVPLPGLHVIYDRLLSVAAQGDGSKDWAYAGRHHAVSAGLD